MMPKIRPPFFLEKKKANLKPLPMPDAITPPKH